MRNLTGRFNVGALSTTTLLALSLHGLVAEATYILVEESPVQSPIALSPLSPLCLCRLGVSLVSFH